MSKDERNEFASLLENNSLENVLRSNGRSKNPEDINVLEIFYSLYNSNPRLYRVSSMESTFYNWKKLDSKMKEVLGNGQIRYQDIHHDIDKNITYSKLDFYDYGNGVMGVLSGGLAEDYYMVNFDIKDSPVVCSDNLFLVKDDFKDFDKIIAIFKECKIKDIKNITIGMVSYDDGSFYVKDFDIKDKTFDLVELDLHYGNGFEDFNNQLIERLKVETKGLTLFHGPAGNGKTTYIRYLLRKIKEQNNDNNVLYFPPTMVGSITDPSFINFISEWVSDSKGKNYIFIEDAEPLLESRDMSRNIGITNLLNLTDGLLNDILNIQVIATFNTNLKNIDKALLRPERLIARKEFKNLSKEKSLKLAQFLNINTESIKEEMTLADIYALKKNTKTITHDIDESDTKMGFKK